MVIWAVLQEARKRDQTRPATYTWVERLRYWLGDHLEALAWKLRDGI